MTRQARVLARAAVDLGVPACAGLRRARLYFRMRGPKLIRSSSRLAPFRAGGRVELPSHPFPTALNDRPHHPSRTPPAASRRTRRERSRWRFHAPHGTVDRRRRPVFPARPPRGLEHWRTASSRTAPIRSSRASACARSVGEKTGFAYSDDLDAAALMAAAQFRAAIARDGQAHAPAALAGSNGTLAVPGARSDRCAGQRGEGRVHCAQSTACCARWIRASSR